MAGEDDAGSLAEEVASLRKVSTMRSAGRCLVGLPGRQGHRGAPCQLGPGAALRSPNLHFGFVLNSSTLLPLT